MANNILRVQRAFFCWPIVFSLLVQGREQGLNETQIHQKSSSNNISRTSDPKDETYDDECSQGQLDVGHRLIKYLLEGYDKNVRPVKNKQMAIKVDFDMAYNQLVDLDGKKQILTSKVWIRQFWINELLTWNKTKYCGVSSIQLNPELIWKPDIVLYNSIGLSSGGEMYKFGTMIIVYSDGSNIWFAPTEIKSICHIDITYFPFDYQNCYLKFGPWTQSVSFLNFTMKRPDTADLSMYYVNGEWELLGVPGKRHEVKYSCCDDPYADITYKIILKRRVLFYLNNLVIPNLILAGLVICSFYVPPESGERISLNVTIMLGLTVFLLLFNERIPPSSEVVPLIGSYYFALFYQVSFSMIVTCISSRCYHHNAFREMPRWFRFLIFRVLAPLFRMSDKIAAPKQPAAVAWQPVIPNSCKKHQHLLLYRTVNGTLKLKEDMAAPPTEQPLDPEQSDGGQNGILEAKVDNISKQLQLFVDELKRNEELEAKKDEWHFASIVLDKLFFWFFCISIFLTTLLFYVRIENQTPNTSTDF